MKKWLIAVLLACGCTAVAAGCGADNPQTPQNPTNQPEVSQGTSLPQVGNLPEGNPDASLNSQNSQVVVAPPVATGANAISMDQAKQIALKHANVSNANFVESSFDHDHGVQKYEIKFYAGNTEYDYEIDASTGAVLSFDHDTNHYAGQTGNTGNTGTTAAAGDIGSEKAKQIALQHANLLQASSVVGLRVERDIDDGIPVYEVEFYNGNVEYKYEINAASGAILSHEQDHH